MFSVLKTSSVLDLPIHITDSYIQWIVEQWQQRKGLHIITLNAEMTMQAQHNEQLSTIIKRAELVIPDGAGVTLFLKSKGEKVQRCPGIELAQDLLAVACQNQWRICLIGGTPSVLEKTLHHWQTKLSGLQILNAFDGYFGSDQESMILQTLAELQPDLILVALGVPRQEVWIAQNRDHCPHAIWMGVGGSFDVWAGVKKRAPRLLRENNLEWLYRLYQEPWRWRRMLALPQFVWRVVINNGEKN
ncbi:MAG: WecB/TagA/CpsF family glycosyltransferase [Oscillatoriales cyanobacterium SM2_2_1]|nr:WecB/TagA/CpsF family glycosyltransferase [Oscillatoriales cyanobacterium SM2_2_1]